MTSFLLNIPQPILTSLIFSLLTLRETRRIVTLVNKKLLNLLDDPVVYKYHKRSISFYPPNNQQIPNPLPGNLLWLDVIIEEPSLLRNLSVFQSLVQSQQKHFASIRKLDLCIRDNEAISVGPIEIQAIKPFDSIVTMKRLEHCSLDANAIVISEFLRIFALTPIRSLALVSHYPENPLTQLRDCEKSLLSLARTRNLSLAISGCSSFLESLLEVECLIALEGLTLCPSTTCLSVVINRLKSISQSSNIEINLKLLNLYWDEGLSLSDFHHIIKIRTLSTLCLEDRSFLPASLKILCRNQLTPRIKSEASRAIVSYIQRRWPSFSRWNHSNIEVGAWYCKSETSPTPGYHLFFPYEYPNDVGKPKWELYNLTFRWQFKYQHGECVEDDHTPLIFTLRSGAKFITSIFLIQRKFKIRWWEETIGLELMLPMNSVDAKKIRLESQKEEKKVNILPLGKQRRIR